MCSGELQLLQSSPPASTARSQWPRAAHSGLMHCTVQPGKYCTFFSLYIGRLQVEPAPAGMSRNLFPIQRPCFLRTENSSEKVARILRFGSCVVKGKDTITSGAVAFGSSGTRPDRHRSDAWFRLPSMTSAKSVRPLQLSPACPQSVLPARRRRANFMRGS